MKLKNVKIGVRVKLKEDCGFLKKGAAGTILQNSNYFPYVSWDNYANGQNGNYSNQTRIDLGLPENSVDYADIEDLKRIKE